MRKKSQFGRARHLLQIAEEAGLTDERFDMLVAEGLLSDILGHVNPKTINGLAFEQALLGCQMKVVKFPVWRQITVGEITEQQILRVLRDGQLLRHCAQEILNKTTFSKKKSKLKLSWVRVKDFDFDEDPSTPEFFSAAKTVGLGPCPAEVGPLLAMDCLVPEGEWRYVGMEPIIDSQGFPQVFRLANDGGPVLRASQKERWGLDNDVVLASLN